MFIKIITLHYNNFPFQKADGTKIELNRRSSPSRDYKVDSKDNKKEPKWVPPKRIKLSEEEKERRRQEMLSNAVERDKERERNVRKFEEQERKESIKETSFDKDFAQ